MALDRADMLRILHLEDCELDRELVGQAMVAQGLGCEIRWAKSGDEFAKMLAAAPVDLVLCDSSGPGIDGGAALALVRQLQPEAVFVFVTGQCKEAIARGLALSGADGIVRKDHLAEMVGVLPRAFERRGRSYGWPGIEKAAVPAAPAAPLNALLPQRNP